MISKFRKGSSVYPCNVCGRQTRDTQSIGTDLCAECFDLAGIENEISDGHCTAAERKADVTALVASLSSKGGDASEWDALIAMVSR